MLSIETKPKSVRKRVNWFVSEYIQGCLGADRPKSYKKQFSTKAEAIEFAKTQNKNYLHIITWE